MSDKPDQVNHPPHYTSHPSGVECIQEDLEKARWYLDREIARRKAAHG